MDDDRNPKKVLNGKMKGRRPIGRPWRTWEDTVREDAKELLRVKNWKKQNLRKATGGKKEFFYFLSP